MRRFKSLCLVWLAAIVVTPVIGDEISATQFDDKLSETLIELEGLSGIALALSLAEDALEAERPAAAADILGMVVAAREFGDLPAERQVSVLSTFARTLNELNRHEEAIRPYRRILASNPELAGVRFELARTFFILEDDRNAEYHFRFVLAAEDLPDWVEAAVRWHLNQIRQRRSWSLNLEVTALGNSNVNVAPTIRQIELYGLPFNLNEDARQKSGFGVAGRLAGEYCHPVGGETRLRMGGYSNHTIYENSRFNDNALGGHFGPRSFFQDDRLGEVSLSVLAHGFRRWFGKRRLNRGAGPTIEMTAEPTDRLRLFGRIDQTHIRYVRHTDYDGRSTSYTITPTYLLSPASYGSLLAGFIYDRTDLERLRNRQYRVGLGYHRQFVKGFTVGVRPEYRYVSYKQDWPAFGARRRDHWYSVNLDVLNRRIEWYGFTPLFGYRYQRRASTINLYRFDQHRGELSLTRRF